jgi:hypothetical protein
VGVGNPGAGGQIRELDGVSWVWADGSTPDGVRELGVLAQQVQEVFPDLVREEADGMLSINYLGLIAPLIEGIKELDVRLNAVESRIVADASHRSNAGPSV